ncbi:hypothetical protein G6O69_34545 [Pseudenhygromyxa sp. WMMC2535]|uniref:hypothetical protein n=1 Tax=Pseudenhygromyxa sp. WMMC2535 TaxID=2712867 RepID=UPI0015543922|nr:hypothetical protein [Pseudenhygromyxa sp. WMMC2535]NVB42993.1 hypothetical protein [Pseudenhygromyxa sp. WMMC2535]
MPRLFPTLLCLSPLLALACTDDGSGDDESSYDPEEIIATAVDFSTQLERLDVDTVESIHLENMSRGAIWANADAATIFRTLDPDDADQQAEFPPGSLFVKELFDPEGNPIDALNVMAKFDPGYFPEANDWFFALIQRDGTVIQEQIGNGSEVGFCVDCHTSLAPDTDLIIGLDAEDLR